MVTSQDSPQETISSEKMKRKGSPLLGASTSFDFEEISNGALLSVYNEKGEVMERIAFQTTGDSSHDIKAFQTMLDKVVQRFAPEAEGKHIEVNLVEEGKTPLVGFEPDLPYLCLESITRTTEDGEAIQIEPNTLVTAKKVDDDIYMVKLPAGGPMLMIDTADFESKFSLSSKSLKPKKKNKDKKKDKKKGKKK